jgi:tetratricopeptide (TPR) repeat protein
MMRKATTSILGNALLAVLALVVSSGCTSLVVNPLLDPLTLSLQKQTDLELLEEGSPSLLLLLDGLIAGDPDNVHLLMAATKAYGAFTTILYENGKTERAVNMSIKARDYGIRLINQLPGLENLNGQTLTEIDASLARIPLTQVGYLFWGAYGWALWIQNQEGSADAMADLPIVERIMLRVVELNESYYYGGAHIFLGSYYGSRPQIYGGKPEESRKHFERALEINNRQFLLTQVAYAQTYARMAFDRELYLKLLTEVLEQPLKESEMASSNKLAKVMAEKLINQVDEFF